MIKIGVVGAGHLGKIHLRILKELTQEYQLIGFYDHNTEHAQEVEKALEIPRFESFLALANAVDCIDVVTPTVAHYQYASEAIKSSKHVFIEKPVAQTIQEAHMLYEFAQQYNVKVQIGHVERFNPAFVAARSYFDQPMFIETHRLSQFNHRGTDVPVVLDLMIHDIDIILSVINDKIKHVSASGVAVVSDTPDIANARIEFENGCVANLTASRISLKNMRKSRFFQKDAYISVDFLTKELEVIRMEPLKGEAGPFDLLFDVGNGTTPKKIYFDQPKLQEVNAIKEELITFAKSIKQNTTPIVSLQDGLRALDVAYQILDQVRFSIKEVQ